MTGCQEGLLGKEEAASPASARCHKVFAGPGGKILKEAGMRVLHFCSNWEDLEADGITRVIITVFWQIYRCF